MVIIILIIAIKTYLTTIIPYIIGKLNSNIQDICKSNSDIQDFHKSNANIQDFRKSNGNVHDFRKSNSNVHDFHKSNGNVTSRQNKQKLQTSEYLNYRKFRKYIYKKKFFL